MLRRAAIPVDEPDRWRDALAGVPHAFAHTWESCSAMRLTTGWPTFLYCLEAGSGRIVCPFAERTAGRSIDIVTPYGFSGFVGSAAYPELAVAWRSFAIDRGYVCGYIALNPLFETPGPFPEEEVSTPNSLYSLDLSASPRTLFRRLDRNRRRELRDWDETRSSFVYERSELTEFLLSEYPRFRARVGASASSYLSEETLRAVYRRPNVWMVGNAPGGQLRSVYLFAHTAHVADCFLNVATEEGRVDSTALLWAGVEHLHSIGVPLLNLGGGVREGDSVARAKQRFGARRHPFRCLQQVYDRNAYQALCARAGVDPAAEGGFFPPYRARPVASAS